MELGKDPLGCGQQGPVWKRAQTSVGGVEGGPKVERGDCSVDGGMRRGRGRDGSIEEGTADSRCEGLRAVGGHQHAPAMPCSRRAESAGSVPRTSGRCLRTKFLVWTTV